MENQGASENELGEMGQLGDLLKKRTASLVTCRGRRRIGKSTLVEEFARRNRLKFMKLEGLSPRESDTNVKQLSAFSRQLGAMTGRNEKPAANWFDAFARLDAAIADVPTVVFQDLVGGRDQAAARNRSRDRR